MTKQPGPVAKTAMLVCNVSRPLRLADLAGCWLHSHCPRTGEMFLLHPHILSSPRLSIPHSSSSACTVGRNKSPTACRERCRYSPGSRYTSHPPFRRPTPPACLRAGRALCICSLRQPRCSMYGVRECYHCKSVPNRSEPAGAASVPWPWQCSSTSGSPFLSPPSALERRGCIMSGLSIPSSPLLWF
jgi:hypothetical protein